MAKGIPALLGAALIVGLLLAACGDEDDGDADPRESVDAVETSGSQPGSGSDRSSDQGNGSTFDSDPKTQGEVDPGPARSADSAETASPDPDAEADISPGSENDSRTPGPSQETETETISRIQFVEEANQICEETVAEVSKKAFPIIGKSGQESAAARAEAEARLAATVMAPALRREVERLQALGLPAGDEAQIEAILEAIEAVARRAEERPETVTGSAAAFTTAANLAERYGIDSCPYG